ncbi:MAG: ABC transporter permease [Candidatus Acidiferrales bacterium]
METIWQDLKYAARMLRKSPGFAAVAIATLALGIGANTAIFSAVNGILLKPLPYADSSRLVQIESSSSMFRHPIIFVSHPEFEDIKTQSRAFEQAAEFSKGTSKITGEGEPENVSTDSVSGDFFSVLGAKPILGRPILPGDAEAGHERVAVLSYELWQRRFGGDPGIIGKRITLSLQGFSSNADAEQNLYAIVGVMQPHYPFTLPGELFIPETFQGATYQNRKRHYVSAIARLRQGTTLEEANAELHTLAMRLATAYPETDKGWDLSAGFLRDQITEDSREELLLLLGAVSFVLLLACVNVSSLLIARSWARRKEVAIRVTLGASRWRIVRQFLAESVLLGLLGGTLGLLLSLWCVKLLLLSAPVGTPRLDEISLDWRVLAYTLGVSLIGGILFGLAPAIQMTRPGLNAILNDGGAGMFARLFSRHPHRMRSLLVVSEIALAFVLVAGSSLLIRSFVRLTSVNLGYRIDHILTMWVSLSPATCPTPDACNTIKNELLERTRALPSVESVAFSLGPPLRGSFRVGPIQIEDDPHTTVPDYACEYEEVTPEYFRTMGIPLLRGRSFKGSDTNSSPRVAIVNETFARRYLGGSPIGRRFTFVWNLQKPPILVEIVGEAGDVRQQSPSSKPIPEFYVPDAQTQLSRAGALLVRTSANPAAIAAAVREQIWALDKNAPISKIETMEQVMSETVAEPRFRTILLSAFGGLGLLLALVGIYGVIAFAASQRTHEIGVRMALGAQPGDILRLVISEGMTPVLVGIVTGAAGALALTRFLVSFLFEVKPTDSLTYAGVTLLIVFVGLLACILPARRASRIEPMEALRYE